MSQEELAYEELEQKIIEELQKHKHAVLATSDNGYVTAREMRLLSEGMQIYCFTDNGSRKYKQISANPNVAISAGNLQIEGIATIKSHPLHEENAEFIDIFRRTQPEIFEIASRIHFKRPDIKVLDIAPKRMTLWIGSAEPGAESYLDILNVITEQAHRVTTTAIKESPVYNE